MAAEQPLQEEGFYSSTSGTYFPDKQSLADHYASDLHRYNLKRKVAGLPPVTKDWFEARKEQLTLSSGGGDVQKVYYDPLTRKKFMSRNAYLNTVNSKKYKDAVRKSGQPAPEPIVRTITQGPPISGSGKGTGKGVNADSQPSPGFKATPTPLSRANAGRSSVPDSVREVQQAEDTSGDESDWESASDDDEDAAAAAMDADAPPQFTGEPSEAAAGAAAGADAEISAGLELPDASEWEEWDVRRSLFDNHVSASFDANLDYMFRNFGFYFPDAEYLKDPEGLLKYLGAKLQYGHVPLGTRGDDAVSRQFRSLHAVQRHMVDSNACKMVYEDDEDEYEDFYDYSALDEDDAEGKEVVMADGASEADAQLGTGGYELALPGSGGGGEARRRVLGNRNFALFYRQRHRPEDVRQSVAVNGVLARYRALNISTHTPTVSAPVKKAQRAQRRQQRADLQARFRDTENNARRQAQGPGQFQR